MAQKNKVIKQKKEETLEESLEKIIDPDADNESVEDVLNVCNDDNNNNEQNNLDIKSKKTQNQNNNSSDSELIKVANLKAEKNNSNLFLIKSYSFIDKTSRNEQNDLITSKAKINKNEKKNRKKVKITTKSFSTDSERRLNMEIDVPTETDMEGHKENGGRNFSDVTEGTINDIDDANSNENLSDCSVVLRQKQQDNDSENSFNRKEEEKQRPKSLPMSGVNSQRKSLKFNDGTGISERSNASIKRESFLRQSLQSIRRSFSGKKKNNKDTETMSNDNSSNKSKNKSNKKSKELKTLKSTEESVSNSSTCSASSCSSSNVKDIDALFASDDDYRRRKRNGAHNVVIQLNGVEVGVRSTNSVATLSNGVGGSESNDSNSIASVPSTLLQDPTEAQSVECLNQFDDVHETDHDDYDPDNLNEIQDIELRKPQDQRQIYQYRKQLSVGSTPSQKSGYYSSLANDSNQNLTGSYKKRGTRTLKQNKSESAISTNSTLGLDTLSPIPSTHSLRSVSPSGSRKSTSGSISSNNSDNTAKNEQSTAAAVASTTAVAASGMATTGPPTEKEKKRKEVSSSRVKKFRRHFTQVPKDEKLINYFSCALVSDILLQGHLYITDQHFAFYSNVFGYVTKVVIPTSSVTRISKEKTAKIIPNAVGVATADERHVFGSFISREAAFRLMCSVCPPLRITEISPKAPADIEISEEYSIEDDSSCSISGNESPPGNGVVAASNTSVADPGQTMLRRTVLSSSLGAPEKKSSVGASNEKFRHSDIPLNAKAISSKASNQQLLQDKVSPRNSPSPSATWYKIPTPNVAIHLATPTTGAAASAATNLTMLIAAGTTASGPTSASATSTPSTTSSSPTTVMATPTGPNGSSTTNPSTAFHAKSISMKQSVARTIAASLKAFTSKTSLRIKFPTELSIVYLGVVLSLVLAVFSVFLLYRIVDIEARATLYRSPMNFNWHSGHDDDIFAEALRWQQQLQDKSTAEAQSILSTNLEQIAKVRRSLETLSMLIRDRSSANTATVNHDDSSG